MQPGLRLRARKLAAIAHALKSQGEKPVFGFAFLTDRRRIPNPDPVLRAMPPGSAVVIRDYDIPNRLAFAARLVALARQYRLVVFIGADINLARRLKADGVHLPRWAPNQTHPSDLLVSMACHDDAEIQKANDMKADLIFASPVFPTQSHAGAPSLNTDGLKALVAKSAVPVFALGGVNTQTALSLKGTGVSGFGVIGALAP